MVKIKYEDNCIRVDNFSNEKLIFEFIDFNLNWNGYTTTLNSKEYCITNINNWVKYNEIINSESTKLIVIRSENYINFCIIEKGELKEIESNGGINILKLKNPPIIIHGIQGGGTSIVTKLLRHQGLFTGKDSGVFNIRKPHESIFFRALNLSLKRGASVSLIKDIIYNGKNKLYFGEKFDNNSIWGFKVFIDETIKQWSEIFPKAKFVSIIKNPKISNVSTNEGKKFKSLDENEAKKIQLIMPENNNIFYLDYEEFFKNYKYTNKVLNYCGLNKIENENNFKKILKKINYEI